MRISDWSSDVCSSDLAAAVAITVVIIAITIARSVVAAAITVVVAVITVVVAARQNRGEAAEDDSAGDDFTRADPVAVIAVARGCGSGAHQHRAGGGRTNCGPGQVGLDSHGSVSSINAGGMGAARSEEHTAELQSLMRSSY